MSLISNCIFRKAWNGNDILKFLKANNYEPRVLYSPKATIFLNWLRNKDLLRQAPTKAGHDHGSTTHTAIAHMEEGERHSQSWQYRK